MAHLRADSFTLSVCSPATSSDNAPPLMQLASRGHREPPVLPAYMLQSRIPKLSNSRSIVVILEICYTWTSASDQFILL